MRAFAIDDPMLALIARFAGCCEQLDISEETFLRQQLDEIRDYVGRYPEEQTHERALEWIARNAERYRRNWKKNLVTGQAAASRCPDCPLERRDVTDRCEIHDAWLEVLNLYVAGETSSQQYVDDTLSLLRRHKERLRGSLSLANTA
ncbi:MAG: hypothetical protein U9Q81_18055 [Pseudomonadota bacterium]|nr:hypothetical protein [Pseudomonadota bacterium]